MCHTGLCSNIDDIYAMILMIHWLKGVLIVRGDAAPLLRARRRQSKKEIAPCTKTTVNNSRHKR